MQYKIKNTDTVFQRHEFVAHFPNTSLPEILTQADLDFLGVVEEPDPEPTVEEVKEAEARAIELQLLQVREQAKANRAEAINSIKVTTRAGNTFDGNERSIAALTQQVVALAPSEVTSWVLADNSTLSTTREELLEALVLAVTERTNLWSL